MKQKLALLLLCFTMVVSLCAVFSFGTAAATSPVAPKVDTTPPEGTDTWNGTTAASDPLFAGGDGTPENPWQIDTAARLAYLGTLFRNNKDYADDSYVLTANIDMAKKNMKYAIGNTNVFKGIFDGGNFTIYNLGDKMFQNLSGTVKNLNLVNATGCFTEGVGQTSVTIKDCNFHINSTKQAFVLNTNLYNATVTLENVVVSGELNYSGTGNCGVFVHTSKAGGILKLTNCVNYANVTAGGNVGAFYGASYGNDTYTDCYNYGNITCTSETTAYSVGGFVGAPAGNTGPVFTNCANYGAISAKYTEVPLSENGYANADTGKGGKAHGVGGFFGSYNNPYGSLNLKNCASYGSVTAKAGFAGGIVGCFSFDSTVSKNQKRASCTLTDVLVLADVTSDTPRSAADIAGGSGAKSYKLTRVYTLHQTYYGDPDNVGSAGNTAPTLKDCAAYVAGDAGTIALLNAQAEATEGYTAWVNGVLPGSEATCPSLATTPHILNASLPEYTVTFVGMNGWSETQTVKEGFAAEEPEAPEVEGYVFDKWDVNFNKITSDLTVTAIYKKLHTVIFVGFDGSNLCDPQIIVDGEAATAPEAPEVEGYNYVGWSEDFETVNSDLTIHALYQIKTYTVTFLGLEGAVLSVQTVEHFAAALEPTVEPIPGYQFNGWDIEFDYITGPLTVKAIFTTLSDLFAGGAGTEADPYIISSFEHLQYFANLIAGTETYGDLTADDFAGAAYRLMADIRMPDPAAGQNNWTPIARFTGIFDGNDHTISNMIFNTNSSDQAFFYKACGTIKNLTMKDCSVASSVAGTQRAVLVSYANIGDLYIDNCHIVNGAVSSNVNHGLMIASQASSVVIKNSSVSGTLKGTSNSYMGGFIGGKGGANAKFYNCTSSIVVTGNAANVGGFKACESSTDSTFENCVFNGYINITAGHAGGILAWKRNSGTITMSNCSSFGTVIAKGYAGGLIGAIELHNNLKIDDCAVYGKVHSTGGYAGGISGYIDYNTSVKVQNVLILGSVTSDFVDVNSETGETICSNCAGTIFGKNNGGKSGGYAKNIYLLSDDVICATVLNQNTQIEYTKLTSVTTLPETFNSEIWGIDTIPMASGVSVTLGNSITLNVYAKIAIVLKNHAADGLYVNGAFVGAGEEATVGGVLYTKYILDTLSPADFATVLNLTFTEGTALPKTYKVTDYLANTYKNYASNATLTALVEAIALYGNAAQLADEQEPTVLNSFVAAAGIELPEDYSFEAYVAEKFRTVNLKTNNTSAAGMGINLSGTIDPIFYVADGITKVEVEIYGETTTIEVVEGVAQFYGLNATSLNNTMQVTFYAGDDVVSTQRTSVACYIEDALAREGFLTDGQTVLAQALAVYMRAARDYVGLN